MIQNIVLIDSSLLSFRKPVKETVQTWSVICKWTMFQNQRSPARPYRSASWVFTPAWKSFCRTWRQLWSSRKTSILQPTLWQKGLARWLHMFTAPLWGWTVSYKSCSQIYPFLSQLKGQQEFPLHKIFSSRRPMDALSCLGFRSSLAKPLKSRSLLKGKCAEKGQKMVIFELKCLLCHKMMLMLYY